MGYRNYLYIADKKKLNKIRKLNAKQLWEFIEEEPDEEDDIHPPLFLYLESKIDMEEAFEFGKYIDFYDRIKKYLKPIFKEKEVQEYYNEEYEFMLAKPEILQECATILREKVQNYYKGLLDNVPRDVFDKRTHFEKLKNDAQEHLEWATFLDKPSNNKYSLGGGWLYEHEVFSLLHLMKVFNPKKQVLIWLGY